MYSDRIENGSSTDTLARSSATPGLRQLRSMPGSLASIGASDPTNSTSSPPTSHTLPLGNTDVKVATIDRRSASLML